MAAQVRVSVRALVAALLSLSSARLVRGDGGFRSSYSIPATCCITTRVRVRVSIPATYFINIASLPHAISRRLAARPLHIYPTLRLPRDAQDNRAGSTRAIGQAAPGEGGVPSVADITLSFPLTLPVVSFQRLGGEALSHSAAAVVSLVGEERSIASTCGEEAMG